MPRSWTSDTHNRKGTDTLVRAIVNLHRRMPQVAMAVLGPGWSELVAEQREQGVRCVHLPFILDHDDLAPIYRCFDIYWITSRIEGGPIPLLEAMSSGACCVTTPVGVARELVKHGENAFLAPIDDAESFVRHTERARSGTPNYNTHRNGGSPLDPRGTSISPDHTIGAAVLPDGHRAIPMSMASLSCPRDSRSGR